MNEKSGGNKPPGDLEPLRIWEQWATDTPKDALKAFNRKGFKGSAIDPTYRLMRLTQMFGPNGIGWGFEIVERWREEIDDGGAINPATYVFVSGYLWFVDPKTGKREQTSVQIGGTHANRTPDESYKMAITDAAGKCCQLLGFAADVYSGSLEGSKYLQGEPKTKQKKPAEPKTKPAEATERPRVPQQQIDALLEKINSATTREQLRPLWQWYSENLAGFSHIEAGSIHDLFKRKGEALKAAAGE